MKYGFANERSFYQLDTENGSDPITLYEHPGSTGLNDASSDDWTLMAARKPGDQYQALIAGQGDYRDQYQLWNIGPSGDINNKTDWTSRADALESNWQTLFDVTLPA